VTVLDKGEPLEDRGKSNGQPSFWTEIKLKKTQRGPRKLPPCFGPELKTKARLNYQPKAINKGLTKLGLTYTLISTVPILTSDHISQRLDFAVTYGRNKAWGRTFSLISPVFGLFMGKTSATSTRTNP